MPPPTAGTVVTMSAAQVPSAVAQSSAARAPVSCAPTRRTARASEPDTLIAHFSWQGTLTSVVIEPSG